MPNGTIMPHTFLKRLAIRHAEKTSCLALAGEFGGDVCLGKNRDRNYVPPLSVNHLEVDGTEVCILLDHFTQWVEGMNEHGVGFVNSTLDGRADESEKDRIEEDRHIPVGPRLLRALALKTPREMAEQIGNVIELEGQSFVGNAEEIYWIEKSPWTPAQIIRLDPKNYEVRSNNGVIDPNAGYTDGRPGAGSVARGELAWTALREVDDPLEIMPALAHRPHGQYSDYNAFRDAPTAKTLRTQSQMVCNLTQKEILLYLCPGKIDWHGVRNQLGREPKIKVRVFEYDETDPINPSSSLVSDNYLKGKTSKGLTASDDDIVEALMAHRFISRYSKA
jgi:hypothetical protein